MIESKGNEWSFIPLIESRDILQSERERIAISADAADDLPCIQAGKQRIAVD